MLNKEVNPVPVRIGGEVSILWTGGWDSTYRVVELSRMPVIIRPVYISGDGRVSEPLEIEAINRISDMLRNHEGTLAELQQLRIIDKSIIPENADITNAYKTIYAKTKLGSQHEWLARYANVYPGLEIGTENSSPETSRIIHALKEYAVLKKCGGAYILDAEKSSREGMLVFGNFSFPIIDKYETDMLCNIKAWGYEDVMKEIWFCHRPIDGKPCGLCHPCDVKMESEMGFLLPEKARKRYLLYKRFQKLLGDTVTDKALVPFIRRVY